MRSEILCCCDGEPSSQLSILDRDKNKRTPIIPRVERRGRREPIQPHKITVLKKKRKQRSIGVQVTYDGNMDLLK